MEYVSHQKELTPNEKYSIVDMYHEQMSMLFQDNLNAQTLTKALTESPTEKSTPWLSSTHAKVQQLSNACNKPTLNNVYAILFELYRSKDPVIVRTIPDIQISKSKFGLVIEFPSYGLYCDLMSNSFDLLIINNKITNIKILRLKDVLPQMRKYLLALSPPTMR